MRDAAKRVFRYPRKTRTGKRGKRLFSVPAKEGPSWSHAYHSVVGDGAGRNPLSLTRGDRSIHAHLSPEQEFKLGPRQTNRTCLRAARTKCLLGGPILPSGAEANDQIHPWTDPYWLDRTGMGPGLTGRAGLIETIP